ncbi:MAG: hypothetical protein ACW99J_18765, partial [Candidatus Thorarchaeota archaeon]
KHMRVHALSDPRRYAMRRESDLYPPISSFLTRHFRCFATGESRGSGHVGRADVVGVRDLGGKTMPDIEMIAVEVKWSTRNFCKNLGQALGYSLFADKCYLAIPLDKGKSFTLEEKEMATHIGVGLINCGGKRIREVLASKSHNPIASLRTRVLWNVGYTLCGICGNAVEIPDEGYGETKKIDLVREEGRVLYYSHRLLDGGKPRKLLFADKSDRPQPKYTYVCPDCLEMLEIL